MFNIKKWSTDIYTGHVVASQWLKVCLCFHLCQGQEEEGVLWFWFWRGPHRSGGPLQERHADPQLQGDPENQRQQARQIGVVVVVVLLKRGITR